MLFRLIALSLTCLTVAAQDSGRTASLNGAWLFTIDPQRHGEASRWFDGGADQRWNRVTVPHCWPVDPRFPYTGAAWYRRSFNTPARWDGLLVRLRFEAVFYKARVWVNGRLAGAHEGGYTPFELDVTRLLKPAGQANLLAVEADNSWDTTTIPGARPGSTPELGVYPWWDFGGIVRDVSLVARPPVHLARQKAEATPDLVSGNASVKIAVWVANSTSEPAEREVSIEVSRDAAAAAPLAAVLRQKLRIPPFSEAAARFTFELRKPDVTLWHPDAPALYRVRSRIDGDAIEDRFGIRLIEVRNAQLLLNGEPIRMGGANREADDPQFGLIEPDTVVSRDLRLMKEAGLELARHVHYAPASSVLEWADRNGMLLILENGNWQFTAEQMDSPVMRAKWQSQMREMMERDWNHPSVIGWSVGNEFGSNTPAGIRWVRSGRDFVRSLDSSRLVGFASNHAADASNRLPGDEASDLVDLVMLNTYASGDQLPAAFDRAHRLWPDKPILVSEFGMRADGVNVSGVPTDGDPVAAQRAYFRDFLAAVRARPWICGASVWTFNDYRSRFPGTNPDGYRWWGLVDARRNLRPAYGWLREDFSPAVLGELQSTGSGATLELRTRSDFPAYTLRGYRLRWTWLNQQGAVVSTSEQMLPDLPPGTVRPASGNRPSGATALQVDVLRPTGFRMIDRRYDLTRR